MKRFPIIILSGLLSTVCFASGIKVSSQEEFDMLGKSIVGQIRRGEEKINVDIMPGHYFFDEEHICFLAGKYGKVNLSITGHDAYVSGRGEKGRFSIDAGYISLKDKTDVPCFTSLKAALSKAELLDAASGLCRMAVDEKPFKEGKAGLSYILVAQRWSAKYYEVQKVEDGFVYFFAPDFEDTKDTYKSPNSEYNYCGMLPRYALVNVPTSKEFFVKRNGKIRFPSGRKVIRCDAGNFLKIRGGEIGSLTVKGIHFLGSGASSSLIEIYRVDVRGKVLISDCTFDGIRGDVVNIIATRSVVFENNVVRNCYKNGVISETGSEKTVIRNNRFYNNGLRMNNYFGVRCRGEQFLISDNYFEDFVYGAIGVGLWYKTPEPHECSGIVENNECCHSPGFTKDVPFNLMDSGAIYTWTINKDVTIRNNYVHDISGPRENRGIFCDDGTVNVKVVGNRVERIANCFCIDLRRVEWVETTPGTAITKTNVGNVVKDNVVDGKIRFETREK